MRGEFSETTRPPPEARSKNSALPSDDYLIVKRFLDGWGSVLNAAQRYRTWASDHPDQSVKEGLLACADREEEIAKRVESLASNASAIQDKLLSDNPELLNLNHTLFEGRPLKIQFAMQAEGERAGAAAWSAYAASASDPSAQELLRSCSPLEQANADFLQTLL